MIYFAIVSIGAVIFSAILITILIAWFWLIRKENKK